MKYLVYILFAAGCYLSVTHWLNNFSISPDSTNYITASENLVKHQSLFVYSNWPSHSYEPVVEPYTEYMPGLPVFTSVIYLLTGNPEYSMLIMNSISIMLIYLITLLLLNQLRFNTYFKIVFLLFLIFFEPFKFIYSNYWTETFFIFWSLLSVYYSIKLLNDDNKKYWVLGCAAVALSAFIKMYGLFNAAFFLVPLLVHRKKLSGLFFFILLSSVFVIIWYIRNELTYGYFTMSHKMFQQSIPSNLMRPFKYSLFLLGNNKLANLWGILLVLISLSPLYLYWKNKLGSVLDFKSWCIFLIGALVNFFGIYLLSLFSSFDYLESRLLAPVYILGFFILLLSVRILFYSIYQSPLKFKYVFLALPLLFFAVNPAFDKSLEWKIRIHYPSEHNLWDEINQKDFAKSSSHYITDFDYTHQIYGKKPQRIIPQDFMFLNIGFLHNITGKGNTPFIVLRNNELPYFYFERLYKILNYQKADIQNKDFTVYVKNAQ